MVVIKRLKGAGGKESCFMGIKFQICKMKKICFTTMWIDNTTEPLTEKRVKLVNYILCVFFLITVKKRRKIPDFQNTYCNSGKQPT